MNIATINLNQAFEEYNTIAPKKILQLDNGNFEYRYFNNPNPQYDITIITLAGGSGMADSLFLMSSELSKNYHFATFNYPLDYPDNKGLAYAISCLIRHENMKNVYLLGQSYGGLIAQIVAKEYPDLIKGLILSSTCSLSNNLTFNGIARMYQMISVEKEKKNKKLSKTLPSWALRTFMKFAFKKHIPDKETRDNITKLLAILKKDLNKSYMSHMDGLLGDLRNHYGTHTKSDFEKYDGEVLIIEPDDDLTFTPDMKKALFDLMTNPQIITDFNGGHLALLLDSDRYLAIVEQFLAHRNPSLK